MSDEMDLKDYKTKVSTTNKARIVLDETEGELIFAGRTQRGYELDFDANVQWGCMPTESLMLSLAGCLAIDMVMFLRKMKCTVKGYELEIDGERNPTPPQYYTSFDIRIKITGTGLDKKKVDRAISLSQDKYCSVYHTLRPDLKVNVDYEIVEG